MLILAIDTSLGPCSVALVNGDTIAAEARNSTSGQQSRVLVPMIESVLAKAGVDYAALDAVACTLGPGGFTGIRTGLATARTITLATGKPLIGVSTLEVIAFAAPYTGDVLAAIDAYRAQWYVQRFRKTDIMLALSEPLLADEKALNALAHGAKIVQAPFTAKEVAALACRKWMNGEREFSKAPVYIREPDAKLPANEGLKYSEGLL